MIFSLHTRFHFKKNHFLGLILIILFGCAEKPAPSPDKEYAEKSFERLDKDILGIKQSQTGQITDVLNDPDMSLEDFEEIDKPGWVTIADEVAFDGSTSPDEARERLLQTLRNKAVKKKVGTEVEIVSLLTDIMVSNNDDSFEQSAWSGFFKSTVSGLIIEENYKHKMTPSKDGFNMEMILNAYVIPVTGQRDPGYFIEAGLESNMLKNGDEININVRPSKDSYLYILNLMADNNAMVIFPNKYMKDNFIDAKREIKIPGESLEGKIQFKVGLIPGKKFISESIYVVCTKDKVPMLHDLPSVSETLSIFPKDSKSFFELQQWLSKIPLNRRVEKALVYHVSD